MVSFNSSGVLIFKIFGALIAFLVQIPLARLLGAEDYGIYIYLLSWIMMFGILTKIGMNTTLPKFMPIYLVDSKWDCLKGVLSFAFLVALLMSAILIVIAGYLYFSIEIDFSSSYKPYFLGAAALLIVFSINAICHASLHGLRRVLFSECLQSVIRPVLLLVVFLSIFYGTSAHGPQVALWSNVLAIAVTTIILGFWLIKKLPAQVFQAKASYNEWHAWMALSFPVLLMGGMNMLLSKTDIIMIGILSNETNAGIYAIASRMGEFAIFGLLAVATILRPLISEAYHSSNNALLSEYLRTAAWFVFIFTIIASVALAILGPFLLPLFGSEFVDAYTPLLYLLAGHICVALTGPALFLMVMTGHQNIAASIQFIVVLMNILANGILIPIMGINGAALATAISIISLNVAMLIYVILKLRLNPTIIPLKRIY